MIEAQPGISPVLDRIARIMYLPGSESPEEYFARLTTEIYTDPEQVRYLTGMRAMIIAGCIGLITLREIISGNTLSQELDEYFDESEIRNGLGSDTRSPADIYESDWQITMKHGPATELNTEAQTVAFMLQRKINEANLEAANRYRSTIEGEAGPKLRPSLSMSGMHTLARRIILKMVRYYDPEMAESVIDRLGDDVKTVDNPIRNIMIAAVDAFKSMKVIKGPYDPNQIIEACNKASRCAAIFGIEDAVLEDLTIATLEQFGFEDDEDHEDDEEE